MHKYFTGSPDPRGWKNQLHFEPGLMVSWSRRIPYALYYDAGFAKARIEPNFSLSLGNIYTQGGGGAVSYTHLRAHETVLDIVCRLLLEKKKRYELHARH